MSKFKVTVEVEVDGDTRKMQWQLAEYLAGGEGCTFFDDYGYEAWGGYDGPYAVSVTVKDEDGVTMTSHANRNKPQEEDDE